MEKVETKISRDLMEAVQAQASKEGRGSDDVVEDAVRSYLKASSGGMIVEVLERMSRGRKERGVEELSEEEAMRLAVEEQHAWRRERREQKEREEGRRSKP